MASREVVSISVPPDIRCKMKKYAAICNWSSIALRAIRKELERIDKIVECSQSE